MKTNVTETSIDCYHNTVVGNYQTECHKIISSYMLDQKESKTRREIGKALNLLPNQYSGRCNELIKAKVLVVVGKRKCTAAPKPKMVEALMHSANLDPQQNLFF